MKVEMKWTGGPELVRALGELPKALSTKVQVKALKKGAEPMRAEAAILAPRGPDAPHLAENIIIGIPLTGLVDVRDEDAVVAVGPSKDFFYGFFWEFGWIRHVAHPFMRPAFDTKAATSLTIIGQELWLSIRIATGRLFRQQSSVTAGNRARGSGVGL